MSSSQEQLYADIDLELSWSERDLPERERTKHVHRLHPYLGKFIPQLVEILLDRYVPAGGRVLDPFAGSGTTLVQSLGPSTLSISKQTRGLSRIHSILRPNIENRYRPSLSTANETGTTYG